MDTPLSIKQKPSKRDKGKTKEQQLLGLIGELAK